MCMVYPFVCFPYVALTCALRHRHIKLCYFMCSKMNFRIQLCDSFEKLNTKSGPFLVGKGGIFLVTFFTKQYFVGKYAESLTYLIIMFQEKKYFLEKYSPIYLSCSGHMPVPAPLLAQYALHSPNHLRLLQLLNRIQNATLKNDK